MQQLCWLPKKEETVRVSDLRPISLLNGSFKMVTKVLTNILGPVLDDLIDPAQSGIIRGPNIHDSVATSHEVIFRSKIDGDEGFLLKLDFEKAYDSVLWDSVMEALKVKGFGQRWIDWIRTCMCTGKSRVLLNGHLGKEFRYCRGLRQGDPLSPLIFTLVADILTTMIYHGREHGTCKERCLPLLLEVS